MTSTLRKATAWTGLYLLAINLIAGALVPAQAQIPLSQLASQAYICTAFGLTAIGPDAGQEPGGPAGHQAAQLCVFCLPLMQGGLDSPNPAVLSAVDISASTTDYAVPPPAFIPPQSRHNAAAPRAPPVV